MTNQGVKHVRHARECIFNHTSSLQQVDCRDEIRTLVGGLDDNLAVHVHSHVAHGFLQQIRDVVSVVRNCMGWTAIAEIK